MSELTTADLLVLALRVRPRKIREWLNAKYGFAGKEEEECDRSGLSRDSAESGKARWSPGSTCSFAACGEGTCGEVLERR